MMLLYVEVFTDSAQKPLNSLCIGFISCGFAVLFTRTNRFVSVCNLHGFLLIRSYCLQIRDNFASSFPTWMTYITLFFLIALAKTSITVLIRSDESGTLFLFLILEGKLSAFTIEYDYIRGFVIYGLSYFEVCFFYPTLRDLLNHKFMLNFLFFFFIY